MTLFVGLVYAAMSMFLLSSNQVCRHGVHVHVIWDGPGMMCSGQLRSHLLPSNPGTHD
jgi:hypothetical protein